MLFCFIVLQELPLGMAGLLRPSSALAARKSWRGFDWRDVCHARIMRSCTSDSCNQGTEKRPTEYTVTHSAPESLNVKFQRCYITIKMHFTKKMCYGAVTKRLQRWPPLSWQGGEVYVHRDKSLVCLLLHDPPPCMCVQTESTNMWHKVDGCAEHVVSTSLSP